MAQLHERAQRPNLFIKNVTLLFSREQYIASTGAYMRGIERRAAVALDPKVGSAALIFVSRWRAAVKDKVPQPFHNRLGIAIARRAYKAYREILAARLWRTLLAAGARPQRLLWASTGTKDPAASDTLYVEALAAPDETLKAFAGHGQLKEVLPVDAGDAEVILADFTR